MTTGAVSWINRYKMGWSSENDKSNDGEITPARGRRCDVGPSSPAGWWGFDSGHVQEGRAEDGKAWMVDLFCALHAWIIQWMRLFLTFGGFCREATERYFGPEVTVYVLSWNKLLALCRGDRIGLGKLCFALYSLVSSTSFAFYDLDLYFAHGISLS